MSKQILATVLAVASIASLYFGLNAPDFQRQLFESWKANLGLEFEESESIYRFKVFKENLQKINAHNSKLSKGHDQGLNQFAFLTQEEFSAQYLSKIESSNKQIVVEDIPNGPTVDWVTYGAVSPVKNQGSCVCSYAFSAVGAIQGISVIYYKTQQQYSVQQVVDCSQAYGNNGCYNGKMDTTFSYVRDKGINTWAAYPYIAGVQACKAATGLFKISGYVNITDCTSLGNALTNQPISVVVDGNNFQFYKSGVFYNCGTNLSLPVLLVGMTDAFWQLKNSWGTTWGEAGYIRIARGNTCGVCQVASYPKP